MDAASLMGLFTSGSIIVDAGMVTAVCEATNWVKERLKEWTWDDPFARFYPAIPFICAAALCWPMEGFPVDLRGLMRLGECAFMYGLYATMGWNVYKKSFKGE